MVQKSFSLSFGKAAQRCHHVLLLYRRKKKGKKVSWVDIQCVASNPQKCQHGILWVGKRWRGKSVLTLPQYWPARDSMGEYWDVTILGEMCPELLLRQPRDGTGCKIKFHPDATVSDRICFLDVTNILKDIARFGLDSPYIVLQFCFFFWDY